MVEQLHVQANKAKVQHLKSGFPSDESAVSIVHPIIFSKILIVSAGMSTKIGGESDHGFEMNMSYRVGDEPVNVEKNRKRFFSHVGISEKDLAVPLQCHSTTVLRVEAAGEYIKCDALITNKNRVALVVTIADCVPILLFDPIKKAIGAVHAGWRGTHGCIVQKTLEMMEREFSSDPKQMLAFIGPSAGACCYEVGDEVAVMFGNKIVPYNSKKVFLDLKNENKLQLQHQGVPESNIEVSTFCTICEKKLFHSFRRDGPKAGRMVAVICVMN
jgi:polyphenol oxidase